VYMDANVPLLHSHKELNDHMDFVGEDIVIFMFTSGMKDSMNLAINRQFAQLAEEVRKNAPKMRFLAYDLNLLGKHEIFPVDHPNMWLSPGNDRINRARLFRGDAHVGEMVEWLLKHASNKFQMQTEDLDLKLEVERYAQTQGISLDGSGEKPKNIMDEVEEELMRRGEL